MKDELEKIIERIKKFRAEYEQNEMAVRNQIINPILRILGWDPEYPEEVKHNFSAEEGVPDYTLLKNGKKILFIEAKKLSIDVEQKDIIRQLAKYCFGEGMRYGILTNGNIWILFRAFQEGTTMAERVVWKTDIEGDNLIATVRKLNTVSKKSIENIENLIKKIQILDEIWQALLDEPEEIIKGLIPVFAKLIREGYTDYEFENVEIEDFLKERIKELITPTEGSEVIQHPLEEIKPWEGGHPRKLTIGKENYSIRNSYEILTNTAEWLINKGKLKKSDCPITLGHKRNLVNIEPKHRYGDNFRAPRKLSNGLFIESHYSTAHCINNARRLIERYGYSSDILEVK
jgi:hypothetical protein